jgi:glycosyltransferase involved in cell wall biosynthesis
LHDFYLSWPTWYRDEHGAAKNVWARALLAEDGWNAVRKRWRAKGWDDVVSLVTAHPCNLAVLQQALGIIVHSEFSKHLARQFYGEFTAEDWVVTPHLLQPTENVARNNARKKLDIDETDFVVCSFGLLDSTKLNHRLLDAWLLSPLAKDVRCRLVFVGENHGGDYGESILARIGQSGAEDCIILTGRAPADEYRQWLAVADLAVQLRTLSRGETSGTVLDCMNCGLPTIVNAHGSMTDLPGDVVYKLPDEFTDAQLADALVGLWRDETRRSEFGARARAYVRSVHHPRQCAEQYTAAIERAYYKAAAGLHGVVQALSRMDPQLSPNQLPVLVNNLANNFPPKPRKPQLLLDVSELVQRDAKTGIQRVTRALLQELIFGVNGRSVVEPVYATQDTPGYRYARKFTCRFLGIPEEWAEDQLVQVWQDDIFLGLDYQADVVYSQQSTLRSWSDRGVRLYFIIHDILPITLPEVFPEGTAPSQQRWLQTISRFDGALCVSRHVADEVFEWLQVFGEKRTRPFELYWFHHGADLDNSAPTHGVPNDERRCSPL